MLFAIKKTSFSRKHLLAETIIIAKTNNRTHHVIGIWSISLKKSLSNTLVKENIKKIDLFIKKHNFSIVNFSYDKIDPFFNINSYRELDKAKKISIR